MEAAVQPGFERFDGPLRSRALLANVSQENQETLFRFMSSTEDPKFFTDNSPAFRLRANAEAVRSSDLAIYLECGDHDAINLHDGNEFLHRLLWDLDISHEYHLVKDADHLGPSVPVRMVEAFSFLSKALQTAGVEVGTGEPSSAGKAWIEWSAGGMQGEAPEVDLTSEDGVAIIREQFRAVRDEVSKIDPTINRRYAILPPTI
jgi:S-formylglutathione hydrolase